MCTLSLFCELAGLAADNNIKGPSSPVLNPLPLSYWAREVRVPSPEKHDQRGRGCPLRQLLLTFDVFQFNLKSR